MSIWDLNFWQWLIVFQHELLLFAGVFFLIGALDDLAIDASWLILRATGRAKTRKVDRSQVLRQPLNGRAAIFIPAWDESNVIAQTLANTLMAWPYETLRLYVGCYRNDPATMQAIMRAAPHDTRLRLVVHGQDGPTTKADCLNRLYQAMRDDERRMGCLFSYVVFQDAEDVVDPAALGMLDQAIADGVDFAQLPVEPLTRPTSRWIGSHYCEEFAEAHGKSMVVRDAMGSSLPGAGVGCAVSRDAVQSLCRRRSDLQPFEAESLTEDYELGLAVAEAGGSCRFVRARGTDDRLVATRAYFPTTIAQAVRQKSRWVHGIALQGWDRVGWSHEPIETWMRARDRKGPLTALVLLVGYSLLTLTLLGWLANAFGVGEPLELSPILKVLLIANLAAFGWRVAMRFAFTARSYGVLEGLLAVLRIPLTNVIAIMAGRRAVMAYVRNLMGRKIEWDKTSHEYASPQAPKVPVSAL